MHSDSTMLGTLVRFLKLQWHTELQHIHLKHQDLRAAETNLYEYIGTLYMNFLSTSSFPIVVLNVLCIFPVNVFLIYTYKKNMLNYCCCMDRSKFSVFKPGAHQT